jgi:ADP-ribosylglycohydrolase
LLRGNSDGWDLAAQKLRGLVQSDAVSAKESEFLLDESHPKAAQGTGYVFNSLWSARMARDESDFESVVRAAIAFGNDTDPTACITGGLAGIRDGFLPVPEL